MSYLNLKGIRAAFAQHLRKYRGYSDVEAAMAVADFPDPYNLPYLEEEFISDEEIDDKEYEKYASVANLQLCGIDDVPVFKFYTYYNADDVASHKVEAYMRARKLYQVDDLDEDDFPSSDLES